MRSSNQARHAEKDQICQPSLVIPTKHTTLVRVPEDMTLFFCVFPLSPFCPPSSSSGALPLLPLFARLLLHGALVVHTGVALLVERVLIHVDAVSALAKDAVVLGLEAG